MDAPPPEKKEDSDDGDVSAVDEAPEAMPVVLPNNAFVDLGSKSEEDIENLNKFKRQVPNLVRGHIELVPDMEREDELVAAIKKPRLEGREVREERSNQRPRLTLPSSTT